MRKKILAVTTALALGAGLAGCATGQAGGDGKTLTISGIAGDATINAVAKAFEAENPGVSVKFTGIPWPTVLTQINTELSSGTAADIVQVFPGLGNPIAVKTLAPNGYLADLSGQSWTSHFSGVNRDMLGANGKVYFAANNFTIIPAVYNQQALAAVGAKAPTTWSEVKSLCETAQAAGKVAYALAGAADGTGLFIPYALTSSLVYGPDPEFAKKQAKGSVSFSDSAWSEALTKELELVKAGCFTKDPTGVSTDQAQDQVAKGDALGLITVSPQIATIQSKAAKGTTFEAEAFPATDNPAETYLPVGLGAGYGVNAKSKNEALAKKFIEFYMSKKGIATAIDAGSIFPSYADNSFTYGAALAGVAKQAVSDKTSSFPDQLWPNSTVNQVTNDELQKLLTGSDTVESALKQMDKAFTSK